MNLAKYLPEKEIAAITVRIPASLKAEVEQKLAKSKPKLNMTELVIACMRAYLDTKK